MTKKRIKKIETYIRTVVEVDISDKACAEFELEHGKRVKTPSGKIGTVIGVGFRSNSGCECTYCTSSKTANEKVLYIAIDMFGGKAMFILKRDAPYASLLLNPESP